MSLVPLCHPNQVTVQLRPFRTEPTYYPVHSAVSMLTRKQEDTQLEFAETRKGFTEGGILGFYTQRKALSTRSLL